MDSKHLQTLVDRLFHDRIVEILQNANNVVVLAGKGLGKTELLKRVEAKAETPVVFWNEESRLGDLDNQGETIVLVDDVDRYLFPDAVGYSFSERLATLEQLYESSAVRMLCTSTYPLHLLVYFRYSFTKLAGERVEKENRRFAQAVSSFINRFHLVRLNAIERDWRRVVEQCIDDILRDTFDRTHAISSKGNAVEKVKSVWKAAIERLSGGHLGLIAGCLSILEEQCDTDLQGPVTDSDLTMQVSSEERVASTLDLSLPEYALPLVRSITKMSMEDRGRFERSALAELHRLANLPEGGYLQDRTVRHRLQAEALILRDKRTQKWVVPGSFLKDEIRRVFDEAKETPHSQTVAPVRVEPLGDGDSGTIIIVGENGGPLNVTGAQWDLVNTLSIANGETLSYAEIAARANFGEGPEGEKKARNAKDGLTKKLVENRLPNIFTVRRGEGIALRVERERLG